MVFGDVTRGGAIATGKLPLQSIDQERQLLLGHETRGQGLRRVHGHTESARGQVVVPFLPGILLDVLVVQAVFHGVQKVHGRSVFVDEHHVPGALAVLLLVHHDGQGSTVIGTAAHLVDVPIGVQEAEVADPNVRAHPFHFLGVPKWEGVVVPIGENDGVGGQ